jgi:hypothetical protein
MINIAANRDRMSAELAGQSSIRFRLNDVSPGDTSLRHE